FPILIKFIDAAGPLSIQVHPDDAYAWRVESEAGKTEMWVILEAQPDAFLYFGFERPVDKAEFARRIADGTLTEVLHQLPVKKGDVVFVAAGTLHAIGARILLAEVQQNSNATYRVFDFGRLGPDGKPRPLHLDKALDVTTLTPANPRSPGANAALAVPGGKLERLAICSVFTVDRLLLDGEYTATMDGSSFVSLLCCDGAAVLESGGAALELRKGESVFIPAELPGFTLRGAGTCLITTV
ncbi:class I mannose-6-phosphate isomerase, partial [Ruminococcaceae bacterium OttesenSCG-928-D13]|nr:class I mannose-6-phosphate isomerase [Ruminococcaceae bacterium OttesenSCG-928-D13]